MFKESIRLMSFRFRTHACCTRFAIVLNKCPNSRPTIIALDEFKHLVLTKVTGDEVIVLVSEYPEL